MSDHVSSRNWEKSRPYNDVLRAYGDNTYWSLVSRIDVGGGVAMVGVHGGKDQADFTPAQVALMRAATPHVRHAVAVRARLVEAERRSERLNATLEASLGPVAHVRADGRLLYASRAAEGLFRSEDGLLLRAGRLTSDSRKASELLTRAFDDAVRLGVGASIAVPRPSGRPAFRVTVTPLPGAGADPTVALLLIDDPSETTVPSVAALMAFFDLTRGEAELAAALAGGDSLEDIAKARNVQITTVRTLLHRALDKTGARRQAEMVALFARLPREPSARA